jgi:hypothetical protein
MKADPNTVIETFGKNEQGKNGFWALFVALAGLVLAQFVDPENTWQITGVIVGAG